MPQDQLLEESEESFGILWQRYNLSIVNIQGEFQPFIFLSYKYEYVYLKAHIT